MKIFFELNTGNDFKSLIELNQKYDIGFKMAVGCYKGTISNSYYVECEYEDFTHTLISELAYAYNQESILLVFDDNSCSLEFCERMQLVSLDGTWQQITKEQADKLDAWTLINGQYWACV